MVARFNTSRFTRQNGQINLLNVEDNTVSVLTDLSFAYAPVWSPDGEQIAFIVEPEGLSYTEPNMLMASDVVTGAQTTLVDSLRIHGQLAWSPDSSQVVFVGYDINDAINLDIFTVARDGSNLQQQTMFPGHETQPTWSPDNTRIAYVCDPKSNSGGVQLIVEVVDTQQSYVLIDDMTQISTAVWQPLSLQVGTVAEVFVQDDGLRVRESAGVSSAEMTSLSSGTIVTLIDGSQEADGYIWWQIQIEDGRTGWAVESADGIQTLIPVVDIPSAPQAAEIPCGE